MKIYKVKVNGKVFEVEVEAVDEVQGHIETPATSPVQQSNEQGSKEIIAPIAGKVISVDVKVGDMVKKGQTVAKIEAMKLENEIQAAVEGKVVAIKVSKGSDVRNKDVLIVLA